ncbi:sterol carrier family protein [Granulicoccus sp. GXG6511]|uniref:sterol carrier family protein n=1 Tax=Granulicoccus sp. GXG6511 TaxID=3381351 RepID=UPI003D7CAEC9
MGIATQQRSAVRGIIDQGNNLSGLLVSLRPAEFHLRVPGADLAVHDVVAQLLVTQNTLLAALDQPTTQRPSSLPDYCAGISILRHRRASLAREIADHDAGPALAAEFQQLHQEIVPRLTGDTPDVVAVDRAALRTVDLLRLISVEWVVHSDDLTRAVPDRTPVDLPRAVLADAVRLLADILRSRRPGGSVEVRIPPFAAVQCGNPGEPRHTRGTPPNIVECRPLPFVRLCRGRTSWPEAVRQNHITASGARANVSEWFPLY